MSEITFPRSVGYSSGSHYWLNYYKAIFSSSHTAIVPNPAFGAVDWFACSYWNVDVAIRHKATNSHTKLWFISGEPRPIPDGPWDIIFVCQHDDTPKKFPRAFVIYCPFYVLGFYEMQKYRPSSLLSPSPVPFSAKTKFCAFLYSHDVLFRLQLKQTIEQYKPVDCLGRSCGKQGGTLRSTQGQDRQIAFYMDRAVDKYIPYKFVIACENTKHPGYVTEKIVLALLAGAIPIYSGAPDVAKHFNVKRFICADAFASSQALVQYIREVDQNPRLFQEIVQQPVFDSPQKELSPFFQTTPF